MQHLKSAHLIDEVLTQDEKISATVSDMISQIRKHGEAAVINYAKELDGWDKPFVLSEETKQEVIRSIPEEIKKDIQFAHKQITRFAKAQKNSLTSFEIETEAGVKLGQKVIPVNCAGCYVPGGRYAHIASALMSVATAKVAGTCETLS